jgi:hypothetical protein
MGVWAACLILGALQPVAGSQADAQASTAVTVTPGVVARVTGSTQPFTVSLVASSVMLSGGLGAYEISMQWDPAQLRVVSATNGSWLGSTGRSIFCSGPFWDTDSLSHDCGTLSFTPAGPSGTGELLSVTFAPLPGLPAGVLSSIDVTAVTLINVAGTMSATPAINDGMLRVVRCPDVNQDRVINNGDLLNVALNLQDRGVDTGARLAGLMSISSTSMLVDDKDRLTLAGVASIDNEQVLVTDFGEGSPDWASVGRAFNNSRALPHGSGTQVYRPTSDGNGDGRFGYTPFRDANLDGTINNSDLLMVAIALGSPCS